MMKSLHVFSVKVAVGLALCALVNPVRAQDYALSADGTAVVRLTSQGTVAASALNSSLFPSGWTSTTGTGGSLSVTNYLAGLQGGTGGAQFQALYTNTSPLTKNQSLQWVQVISTNDPLGNVTSPYLDNAVHPSQPFYSYTAENRNPSLPANQLNFYDFSQRAPADLKKNNPVTWNASLFPVISDGSQNLTVQNGVSWGWTMKPAMVGSTSAKFVDPSPSSGVVGGVGTNSFSWGSGAPDQSSLTFTGGKFDAKPGTPFVLGTLTYHNGTIVTGTQADSVGFDTSFSFDNVSEKNFDLSSRFTLTNTLNSNDPIASADQVTLNGYGYTFNVLEGATASVDIMGMLTTDLKGSASPSGGSPSGARIISDTPLDPNPDYVFTFTGFGNPTPGGFITDVPEPSTCYLALACFVAVIRGVRRSRRKRS